MKKRAIWVMAVVVLAAGVATIQGSSHREAPGITKTPKVDGTDFYMFRSYEAGRLGFVTLLANYVPLQDVYGGPNFFMLDEDGLYEIHIDNNGDAVEDITFQLQAQRTSKDITVPVGDRMVSIPFINIGGIGPGIDDTANLNVEETYTLSIVRGKRRTGHAQSITDAVTGSEVFKKPVDRIGDKSIRDNDPTVYNTYANNHIFEIAIPGCDAGGRVFVGQRREGFVFNLAETFDLINTNPLGPENGETNDLADKNITTIALEVPISCLRAQDPVIGAWTTSSLGKGAPGTRGRGRGRGNDADEGGSDKRGRGNGGGPGHTPPGQFTQVSRLGHALVNEVVIGLKDKDGFNASEPSDDVQFLEYVTHPTLPVLIQELFGVPAPAAPRNDLVAVFLTGVPGLNQPEGVRPSEMLRLNTETFPVPPASQDPLGVIGGDNAGFPNGRRPGDDVIDITLRVVEGILLSPNPAAFPKFTDGAFINATIAYDPDGTITANPSFQLFRDSFPYLNTPLSGSPNPTHQN